MSPPDGLKRVLVVDDEENIRHLLLVVLKKAGYEPTAVAGGEQALELLSEQRFPVVISDIRMPGMDGRELLAEITAREFDTYVVMMSAYGGDEVAIECMKAGAYDYFNKPFTADEVVLLLRKIQEREVLFQENQRLREELDERFQFDNIIGRSDPMKQVFGTVTKIAPYKTTVLLTGESGTGKELLARAVHRNSDRAAASFVPINCAAIPENLLESELFGHARGAFTGAVKAKRGLFQEASGGTLFLDEMGEMPISLQVKLLRVLENDEIRRVGENKVESIDVRLIAATSRDLEKRVAEGTFREDLFYRLNVVHIRLPPLRERPEDVPLLIEHFLARFNRKFTKSVTGVEAPALKALLAYPWPGNVRELENALERAMLLGEGDQLALDSFPPQLRDAAAGGRRRRADDHDLSIKRRVASLEADLIARALEHTGGNRTHACKLLEISHRALLYKMRDYGIDVPARSGGGS
ncbi:MAG: sigma-54-dependent Fis family transcriptional regulator [Proteobacteria bacterium]|nr:sigma-54-dependent Fis family transcriptional regulator [Pseudomonadota bacterium]